MRALLVFVVVVMGATPAFALMKREPMPLCDVGPATYPRAGSTNVPRNARAWVLGGTLGNYVLVHGETREPVPASLREPFRIVDLALPHLDADTKYTLYYADVELTTFTTGASDDTTPPDAPTFSYAAIDTGPGTPIALTIETSEPWLVELSTESQRGTTTMLAPASTLARFAGGACARLQLAAGEYVCFRAVALDLAGNRSPAAHQCTTVARWTPPPDVRFEAMRDPDAQHTTWFLLLLGGGFIVGLVIAIALEHAARTTYRKNQHTAIAIEIVRSIAASQRRRTEWTLLACLIGFLVAGSLEGDGALVLASLAIVFVVVTIAKAQRLHLVLTDLDAPDASATYDGASHLFTQHRRWVLVDGRELQNARDAVIPVAKVH